MIDLKGLQSHNSQLHDAFYPETFLALFSDESKCARVCHGNVRWPCLRKRCHQLVCAVVYEVNLE